MQQLWSQNVKEVWIKFITKQLNRFLILLIRQAIPKDNIRHCISCTVELLSQSEKAKRQRRVCSFLTRMDWGCYTSNALLSVQVVSAEYDMRSNRAFRSDATRVKVLPLASDSPCRSGIDPRLGQLKSLKVTFLLCVSILQLKPSLI